MRRDYTIERIEFAILYEQETKRIRRITRKPNAAKIGRKVGIGKTAANRWAKTFVNEGLDGLLREGEKNHQDPKITRQLEEILRIIQLFTPDQYGYPTRIWSQQVAWLLAKDLFEADYSLSTVCNYLYMKGWSFKYQKVIKEKAAE